MADKIGHVILASWREHYKNFYGDNYIGNRFRDASMLKGVADDLGEETVVELIGYYFSVASRPDFTYFIFNYDKIIEEKNLFERDQLRRSKLREKTRERMIELGVPFENTVNPNHKGD